MRCQKCKDYPLKTKTTSLIIKRDGDEIIEHKEICESCWKTILRTNDILDKIETDDEM